MRLGDDPIVAIDDVLATVPADQIVVVPEADGHQNWRERRLPEYLWKARDSGETLGRAAELAQ